MKHAIRIDSEARAKTKQHDQHTNGVLKRRAHVAMHYNNLQFIGRIQLVARQVSAVLVAPKANPAVPPAPPPENPA